MFNRLVVVRLSIAVALTRVVGLTASGEEKALCKGKELGRCV